MKLEVFACIVPVFVVSLCAVVMVFSKKDLSKSFLEGAKNGVETSFSLIPAMVMLVCAVRMFCASGALEVLSDVFSKPLEFLGIPKGALPLLLVRPFSGAASTAVAQSIFTEFGADSFTSNAVSILLGSSDTILYTLFLYLGEAKIKRTRFCFPVSFAVFAFCTVLSCALARMLISR